MMKSIIPFFILTVLFSQCSVQKHSDMWKVENVKTNYVSKGISDKYELPLNLKGKQIQIQDSLLILSEIRKNYIGSALSDEFGDTIILRQKKNFKKQKDDEYTLQYPSDEFVKCVENNNDTCYVSETFLSLLEVNGNSVNAYLSSLGKHLQTKCILFILKEDKAVFYSENDFLLLFLTKNK